MISKRTQKYLETAMADKQAATEVTQAIESAGSGGGGGDAQAIADLQDDVQVIQDDVQELQTDVQAATAAVSNKQTIHEEILSIYQVAQQPTLLIRSSAGVGASGNFVGPATNNAGSIVLNTGSGSTADGEQFQFQADIAPGNDRAIVALTPANADTAAIMSGIYVIPGVQGKWGLYSAVALDPNKTYFWHYLTLCVK